MTIQAQEFWTQTRLTNVRVQITNLRKYALQDEELADMYNADAVDFEKAIELFRNSDGEGLANHIDHMDTSPREQLVIAFNQDCGSDFVRSYLGYELA